MAHKPLQLRCKTKQGQHYLTGLNLNSNVGELKKIISDVSAIPTDYLKIMQGYPPKVIQLTNNETKLESLPFRSGDTLIVEEDLKLKSTKTENTNNALLSQLEQETGILVRKVVPANNSCLFTSIHTLMTDGILDVTCSKQMRELIAGVVLSDPETYSEAFLGKTNENYCNWIMNSESWGGAIEISILSKYYGIEIDVVDTQTARIDRFGEDKHYHKRILLLYDGIHYDPLLTESTDGKGTYKTRFSCTDDSILAQALDIASEAKSSKQFTDVSNFTLRCLICQKRLSGQTEAQSHAKESGHINFGEC